jgi:hypothetical protein
MKTRIHNFQFVGVLIAALCMISTSQISNAQVISRIPDLYTSPKEPINYEPVKFISQAQPIRCLASAMHENEIPSNNNNGDQTNYGCDGSAFDPVRDPMFTEINIGHLFCGTSYQYVYNGWDYRDTDWYRLVIDRPHTVYWSAIADFPVEIIIFKGSCDQKIILNWADLHANMPGQISAVLQPGEYYFWIAPNGWGSGFEGNYMVLLSEVPPANNWYKGSMTGNGPENVQPSVTNLQSAESTDNSVETTSFSDGTKEYTIYIGYKPDEVQLMASGGLSYKWTPTEGLSNAYIRNPIAKPASTTTYTVYITDEVRNVRTERFLVNVIDVGCGNDGSVVMCPGPFATADEHYICVDRDRVYKYLVQGYRLGYCQMDITKSTIAGEQKALAPENLMVKVYPNPSRNHARIEISLVESSNLTLQVTDLYGKLVENIFDGTLDAGNYTFNWSNDHQAQGVYFLHAMTNKDSKTIKLMTE